MEYLMLALKRIMGHKNESKLVLSKKPQST